MQLTRGRVVLRVVLLTVGGAFMLFRGWEAHGTARLARDSGGLLASRLALVWLLVGVLALVTAAGAALSLRHRRKRSTLRLGVDGGRDRGQ